MSIPDALFSYEQWVGWKKEPVEDRITKIPINPHTGKSAGSTKPDTWGSVHDAARAQWRHQLDGIGFVFSSTDPFIGIDIDDCVVGGKIDDFALAHIKSFNSYTEFSPSGKGIHIFVEGTMPEGDGRRRNGIEMYGSGRYFTVTGDHVAGSPLTINQNQEAINALYVTLTPIQQQEVKKSQAMGLRSSLAERDVAGWRSLGVEANEAATSKYVPRKRTDAEVLKMARDAGNGAKFTKLWNGEVAAAGGDSSWSAADMSLCILLAGPTQGDVEQMDRLFRQSGLFTKSLNSKRGNKWDQPRNRTSTYGRDTIDKAIMFRNDHRNRR